MLCLPSFAVEALKTKLKNGSITPEKLSSMTDAERRTFLESVVGKDQAADVNALIESKLLLKDQQRGLITAMNELLGNKESAKRDLLSKVNKLDKVLSPDEEKAFLHDLASKKLGADVSLDEAKKITELAKKANDLKEENPKMSGVSDEYLKARNDLNNYVESLKPLSDAASIGKNLEIIARNNLLLNPATPIKTTIGQIENTALDAITRRLSSLSLRGENPDLAAKANAEAWETFKKTGNNTASMETLDDTHMLGRGEKFTLPKGNSGTEGMMGKGVGLTRKVVEKTAEVSNKIAINFEHNISFTKFYQKTFFDSANLVSSDMAKTEGLKGAELKARAAEIMQDATRIEPKTEEGKLARMAAQRQAARITATNETIASNYTLMVKRWMNKNMKGTGDILMPIAKIPANIIANGLDNAGFGLPKGIIDIWKGHEALQSPDMETRLQGLIQFREGVQRVGRIVGTTGVAALIASKFNKKDFRTDNYGVHFIKLGNTWVNTEYISLISPALGGFMQAKEKGTGLMNDLSQYAQGSAKSIINLPGSTNEYLNIVNEGIAKYGKDFLTSRITPAILKSLFGGSGRPFNELLFGAHGVESDAQVKEDARKAALTRKKK